MATPIITGYIEQGYIHSLTQYFPVSKMKEMVKRKEMVTDWRIMYAFSKSSFNDHMWSSNYPLPTQEAVLCQVSHESFLGDLDGGEQFLNFPLDPRILPYAGVDLTPLIHREPPLLGSQ